MSDFSGVPGSFFPPRERRKGAFLGPEKKGIGSGERKKKGYQLERVVKANLL